MESCPSDTDRLAIYFPPDEDKPRFIWLPCGSDGGSLEPHRPWCRKLLNDGHDSCDKKAIMEDPALDRKAERDLVLLSRAENMDDDRFQPNRSILTATEGYVKTGIRGGFLAYAAKVNPDGCSCRCVDVKMIDFTHVLNTLRDREKSQNAPRIYHPLVFGGVPM